jgi:hypothetical protein
MMTVLRHLLVRDHMVSDEPAIDVHEELASGLIKSRIGVHGFSHGAYWPRPIARHYVSERSRKRVTLQVEELLQLGNSRGIGGSSTLFPLPNGTRCSADGTCETTLREAGVLSSFSESMAKRLPLGCGRHVVHPSVRIGWSVPGQDEDAAELVRCRAVPSQQGNPSHRRS